MRDWWMSEWMVECLTEEMNEYFTVSDDFAQFMTVVTMWPNDRHHKWNYTRAACWIMTSKNNEKAVAQSYLNVLHSSTLFSSQWRYIQYSLDSVHGNYEVRITPRASWEQTLSRKAQRVVQRGEEDNRTTQTPETVSGTLLEQTITESFSKWALATLAYFLVCLEGKKTIPERKKERLSYVYVYSVLHFHKAKIHTVPWHIGGCVTV